MCAEHLLHAAAFIHRNALATPTGSSQNGFEQIKLSDPRDFDAIKQLMKL
jgi:hypothetical protein